VGFHHVQEETSIFYFLNVVRLFKSFRDSFSRKFSQYMSLRLPPNPYYVATLSCEILKFEITANYHFYEKYLFHFTHNFAYLHKFQSMHAIKHRRCYELLSSVIYIHTAY